MYETPEDRVEITRRAIDMYLLSKRSDGLINGLEYWQTANGYTAIALHDLWTGSLHYKSIVESALSETHLSQPDFINDFNDDSMWWALASIAAYHAYGQDEVHLRRAQNVQKHVASYVVKRGQYNVRGMDMEGGVLWTTRPNEQNINVITTGLFAELTGELAALEALVDDGHTAHRGHNLSKDNSQALGSHIHEKINKPLIATALRSLDWIRRCRLSDGIAKDTIKVRDQQLVDWVFTYNTGQLIGAAVALAKSLNYHSSCRDELLDLACSLAEAAMEFPNWHEADGTLTEADAYGPLNHQAYENDDAVGFKSVLVRNLAKLYHELTQLASSGHLHARNNIRSHLRDYFILQFNSLQKKNVNEMSQYGPWWAGPYDLPTSHAQMAILDVMAAIHLEEAKSH